MPRPRNRLALAAAALALAACSPGAAPAAQGGERPALGLMTSLPLYWPEDAALEDLAAGRTVPPWQREALERRYDLVPLDTLSPIAGLSPDAPETDPLADFDRLAIIQPRGLSPADNVALDGWVRDGGRLLLVLDPALTGDYDLPLGDPRRPVETALIPPLVARWGLAVSFDETQDLAVETVRLGEASLPLALSGKLAIADPPSPQAHCTVVAKGAAAQCRVGKGRAMILADAAAFEHRELAGEGGAVLLTVLAAALE